MTKNPKTFFKGEDETLDFQIDMRPEFAERNNGSADTITSVSWTVSGSDLAIESQSNTDGTVTVWLSGGQHGNKYQVVATMNTTGGRLYERYFNLLVA